MNIFKYRLILIFFLIEYSTLFSQANASSYYCQLSEPSIKQVGKNTSLQIKLKCSNTKTAENVLYPSEKVYLGATLYKIIGANNKITYSGQEESQTDLPDQLIDLTNSESIVNFSIDKLQRYSHIVFATWSQKLPCEAYETCSFGHKLGPSDDEYNLPMPIDTFPKPYCDIQKLTQVGFFEEANDISGYILPDNLKVMFLANDCWRKTEQSYGLGYTLRRWRLYPLDKIPRNK